MSAFPYNLAVSLRALLSVPLAVCECCPFHLIGCQHACESRPELRQEPRLAYEVFSQVRLFKEMMRRPRQWVCATRCDTRAASTSWPGVTPARAVQVRRPVPTVPCLPRPPEPYSRTGSCVRVPGLLPLVARKFEGAVRPGICRVAAAPARRRTSSIDLHVAREMGVLRAK